MWTESLEILNPYERFADENQQDERNTEVIMHNSKQAVIRCDDNIEAVVFCRTNWVDTDGTTSYYELNFEDNYCYDGNGIGLIRRLRRAWHAFRAKPVSYSGICCSDTERIKNFLTECLQIVDA